ncbi:uncharacterized protein [Physcomitrium patens]|uniref:HTH myb-type domain-containing protein n=1 Tax=Physcomitrium patens TaxID=3218 RepID=A0A2K1K355_PHYPA|nr:uncharacterized protein LOC112287147 isoform X2 [Physcomitrium patens]PNR48213.1 hypothetical protein PHYPA_012688 [Physcomitrium patens]|eukprot:XP_024385665.1 uncharacterized protein LOC112287147 isoform X2 [Physcomitrella patens]
MRVRANVVGMTMKDEDYVLDWKHRQPKGEELTPSSKSLKSSAMVSCFSIQPVSSKSTADLSRESHASFLDLQVQRSTPMSFNPFPPFKELKNAAEAGDDRDGRGVGQFDKRGKSITADFTAEGRGDARGDGRGTAEPEVEVGLGLGLGSGGSCSNRECDRVTVAERQRSGSHGGGSFSQGHPMSGVFRGGSDGATYNPSEGRSEQSSGLPFMKNGLQGYGSGYERRPESSSYGGRGDDSSKGGGSAKNARKLADSDFEDTDSGGGPVNSNEEANARTLKRPRLVWTPQLHKRFVDAVGHLGIKNAVPKTIMQLMNVEGLTRENVASHLQKYRLYLKRMQGLPSDGPMANDQLFASTSLPSNLGMQYMTNQREEVGPASYPAVGVAMPFPGGGVGPLGTAQFGGYEQMSYDGVNRRFVQRPATKDRTEHISESENGNHASPQSQNAHSYVENRAGSPPRRLLSLFPTSSG